CCDARVGSTAAATESTTGNSACEFRSGTSRKTAHGSRTTAQRSRAATERSVSAPACSSIRVSAIPVGPIDISVALGNRVGSTLADHGESKHLSRDASALTPRANTVGAPTSSGCRGDRPQWQVARCCERQHSCRLERQRRSDLGYEYAKRAYTPAVSCS